MRMILIRAISTTGEGHPLNSVNVNIIVIMQCKTLEQRVSLSEKKTLSGTQEVKNT